MGKPSKKAAKQPTITKHALPLLKKPLETIEKLVSFPGSYWKGRMTDDERAANYQCAVKNFTLTHKFSPAAPPEMAFQVQEMGQSGNGSTELGDASVESIRERYYAKFRGKGGEGCSEGD